MSNLHGDSVQFTSHLSAGAPPANLGGRAEAYADEYARPVTVEPTHMVPTRYGNVAAKFYMPDGETVAPCLVPRHPLNRASRSPIEQALAEEPRRNRPLNVMTMALQDLQAYIITPRTTNVIEDAVSWMQRPNLAPTGASLVASSREVDCRRRP